MRAVFIYLDGFRADLRKLGFVSEDEQAIEQEIMNAPARWPVIAGTGGIRKMRFAPAIFSRGRSGACRICYVWFEEYSVVLLVLAFGKNRQANLTAAEKTGLRKVLEFVRRNLENGRY